MLDLARQAGVVTRASAWHIVTCEYPPDVGGVSDYARTMARALAAAGCHVHVWCSGSTARPGDDGVTVHAVSDAFSPAGLRRLGRALNSTGPTRRLFVQWVPHGYGYRSLNLWFAIWLAVRALRGDEVEVLVHEPFLAFSRSPRQAVAALVHRLMLVLACRGASRVWMSTPSWAPMIRPYVPARLTPRWLPIPAVGGADAEGRSADHAAHGNRAPVVGHFSAHSPLVTALLGPAMETLLRESDVQILLMGRDSERFLQGWLEDRSWAAGRVRATGTLAASDLQEHIASCDVMLQPYPDGVSTRRTTILGMFAAGAAVVTNAGALTEPLWRTEDGLVLVPSPDADQLARATLSLTRDAARRTQLGASARELYARLFHVDRSVAQLLAPAA